MTTPTRVLQQWRMWSTIAAGALLVAVSLTASPSAESGFAQTSGAAPSTRPADVDSFRKTIEPIFMRDRGGTMPGYAACVMCHTWQTSLRFDLETPETDAGWTAEQSRRNFQMITQLVNTRTPENSRLLVKPLEPKAGGMGHTGGTYWSSREDPEFQTVLKWIRSLPADAYVPKPEPAVDFEFFRACVQNVFATPREGHIRCSNCHGAGQMGFAPVPGGGRTTWNEEEARQAFRVIARLIVAGNPVQSRFLLKPLHPDGGGSYAHNGVRRWQTRDDPEWQMLAAWVRGERKGSNCS
ncbi:MAG TPA: hypothetical protein VFB92_24195 [Vicinamibacterales bacterium]|nr:hypothetical protein [Vicinamibacterales bacterium]